jgi:NAD(P)-dependent dehydrogenase (short-subunit alcohol dehydrogenase family)
MGLAKNTARGWALLVTGANPGIGRAIPEHPAREGFEVILGRRCTESIGGGAT